MSKSLIYTANTAASAIAVGGTVPLGNIVRRYGCALNLSAAGILIKQPGYYDLNAVFNFIASAAGTVTVTAYQDGVAIPGATATVTAAAANNEVSVPISAALRVLCNNPQSVLTFVATGQAVTNANTAVNVSKS